MNFKQGISDDHDMAAINEKLTKYRKSGHYLTNSLLIELNHFTRKRELKVDENVLYLILNI